MMIRLARAGTREIMLTDTVKFARAAGLSEATILRRHVLKLISIPIVTVFGLEFGSTLAFAVVTETIFSWPGIGKLIIDSIAQLDRPVMVAYLILIAFLFVTINLAIDLVYALLDPRLRRRGGVNARARCPRFWSEFRESRIAVAALAIIVGVVIAVIIAPLITPQDPYDLANLPLVGRPAPAGLRRPGRLHAPPRHRRAGPRPLFGDPLRPSHLAADGARRRRDRARHRRDARHRRGLCRRARRGADHAHRRPAALLPGDPARARARGAARPGQGAADHGARRGAVRLFRPHRASAPPPPSAARTISRPPLATPLSGARIVFRHLLPNSLPPLIVVATVQVANSISLEATLSFLGLGLPPTEPSLGMLIANGFQYMMSGRYWISIYPGIALIIIIVAINLVGDQVRDQLNPRLRR